ncbi:MAG TPA: prolipoprotein diacylglyceryl transferase [Terriglobales bacterium]|nr:prolipoprotein diacylglyceryl transferase [Terriglobales bacterium]
MFPHLFHLGSFSLPTYGFLVATGVLVGLIVAAKMSQWQGLDPEKAWNLGILAVLCAIVGAKILLFINDWDWYASHPEDIFSLSTWQAGGVFYGGLIGAIAVSVWYIRRNNMPVLRTCDAFAPGLALGHAIGRVGCFAAGCCYGEPTSLPWGATFTNPLAHAISGTPLGIPLHPTQLYETAVELTNFFILTWLIRHKKFEGQVIGTYLFLYGVARYFLEFLRDDPERGSVLGGIMTGTQLISIVLVLAGGALWVWRKKMPVPAVAHTAAR